MFNFKLLPNLRRAHQPESEEDFRNAYERWRALEDVGNSRGYREAVEYFELLINSKMREEQVDRKYIEGIEAVFLYFESAKDQRKRFEERAEEYGYTLNA